MLGNCWATHLHAFRDLSDRSSAVAQAIEDQTTRSISQRIQDFLCIGHPWRFLAAHQCTRSRLLNGKYKLTVSQYERTKRKSNRPGAKGSLWWWRQLITQWERRGCEPSRSQGPFRLRGRL